MGEALFKRGGGATALPPLSPSFILGAVIVLAYLTLQPRKERKRAVAAMDWALDRMISISATRLLRGEEATDDATGQLAGLRVWWDAVKPEMLDIAAEGRAFLQNSPPD